MKVFNLSKKYSLFKYGDLQKNLDIFYKEYGKYFKIKYDNIIIDVSLIKLKLLEGLPFYRMKYDIQHRTHNLCPFIIDFIDPHKMEKNNNTYIADIHKTDIISGKELIKICLKINEILGSEKTYIGDGTQVKCDKTDEYMDLSFIKLIEKNSTYYMNLGFDFDVINNNQYIFYMRHKNKDKLIKEINSLIKNIRKIKTYDLIKEYNKTLELIILIIKDNYEKKFEILLDNSYPVVRDQIYVENPKEKIMSIFSECIKVLEILNKYKDEHKFYKILIKLFKEYCDEYLILFNNIIVNNRVKIIYGNNIIKRDYILNFKFLMNYRYNYSYSYTFPNKNNL